MASHVPRSGRVMPSEIEPRLDRQRQAGVRTGLVERFDRLLTTDANPSSLAVDLVTTATDSTGLATAPSEYYTQARPTIKSAAEPLGVWGVTMTRRRVVYVERRTTELPSAVTLEFAFHVGCCSIAVCNTATISAACRTNPIRHRRTP